MRDKARIGKVELTLMVTAQEQMYRHLLLCLSPTSPWRTNCSCCLRQGSGVMALATLPAVVCLWLLCFPVICGNWWWQRFCPAANADFWVRFPFFPGQVEEVQQHDCFTHGQFDCLTAGTLVQEPVIFQFWQVILCAEIVLQIKWNYYLL